MKLLAYILRLVVRVISSLLYFMAWSVVLVLLAMMLYAFWC